MRIPICQNILIDEITAVQPNTIIVLHNGSPIEMPWVNKVKGIVEAYLSGQAVGGAVVDILFGKVNPSAKLPESFPLCLEDNPSFINFPGEEDIVEYKEGIFVGYRYYDKKKMNVLFPFGFGLSYTTFEYSNLKLSKSFMKDTESVIVTVDVKNTGNVLGKEIVQVYVADKQSTVIRPIQELREFGKVELEPGETKTITFELGKRAFAYYNIKIHDWHVESGEFDILIGKSSRQIELSSTITVESTVQLPFTFTKDTLMGDIMHNKKAMDIINEMVNMDELAGIANNDGSDSASEAITAEMQEAMMKFMPLRGVISFGSSMTVKELEEVVERLNKEASVN